MFLVYPLSDFSLALLSSICTRAQHCLAGCDCTFARQPLTRPRIVCCQPSRCRNVQPQANTNTWCKLGSAPLLSFRSDCATARQRLHFPLLCALSFRKIFSPSHVCVCVVCVRVRVRVLFHFVQGSGDTMDQVLWYVAIDALLVLVRARSLSLSHLTPFSFFSLYSNLPLLASSLCIHQNIQGRATA